VICFVDTSALLALVESDDENHAEAHQAFQRLRNEQVSLLTTNYVVVELFAHVQRRIGIEAVRDLQTTVLPEIALHWVDESAHQAAIAALFVAGRRRLSLIDYTSFEVMRRLGIADVFAFDPHFAEQGFHCHPR
jgi:predicted nucleic acid-binding protein